MIPTNQLTLNQTTDSQMMDLKPAAYGGKRSRKNRSGKRKQYKKRGGSSTLKNGGRKNKSEKRKRRK